MLVALETISTRDALWEDMSTENTRLAHRAVERPDPPRSRRGPRRAGLDARLRQLAARRRRQGLVRARPGARRPALLHGRHRRLGPAERHPPPRVGAITRRRCATSPASSTSRSCPSLLAERAAGPPAHPAHHRPAGSRAAEEDTAMNAHDRHRPTQQAPPSASCAAWSCPSPRPTPPSKRIDVIQRRARPGRPADLGGHVTTSLGVSSSAGTHSSTVAHRPGRSCATYTDSALPQVPRAPPLQVLPWVHDF